MRGWARAALRKIRPEHRLVPIFIAAALAVIVALVLWSLSPWYGEHPGEISRGIYIEATGALMDIVVFGFVLALLALWTNRRRERSLSITRQKELVDDFKKWDADEARHRIAGALRRLNHLGSTKIDFSGLELSDFSFGWHEIEVSGAGCPPEFQLDAGSKFQGRSSRMRDCGWPAAIFSSVFVSQA